MGEKPECMKCGDAGEIIKFGAKPTASGDFQRAPCPDCTPPPVTDSVSDEEIDATVGASWTEDFPSARRERIVRLVALAEKRTGERVAEESFKAGSTCGGKHDDIKHGIAIHCEECYDLDIAAAEKRHGVPIAEVDKWCPCIRTERCVKGCRCHYTNGDDDCIWPVHAAARGAVSLAEKRQREKSRETSLREHQHIPECIACDAILREGGDDH